MTKPKPSFTIEELIQEAIHHLPDDTEGFFTPAELRRILNVSGHTMLVRLNLLEEKGWQIIPGRKAIVDRAGRHTSAIAYKLIPPNDQGASD